MHDSLYVFIQPGLTHDLLSQWLFRSTLRIVLPRVLGVPNNARSNMDNIVALFDDSRTAEKAEKLVNEFIEYIDSM